MKDNIKIRNEREDEFREVENLVRDSFWNVYRPGCLEHFVLKKLRDDFNFVKELDFVMVKENGKDKKEEIIGQNVFVKTFIESDDGKEIPILTMGPICIKNELKRSGFGKILLDYSFKKAEEMGFGAVCFEGNIDFYGKSACKKASDFGIRYFGVEKLEDAPFFLCRELKKGYLDGVSGVYKTPEIYFVDEKEFEKYESGFPYKKKKKLEGQLF